ncbi:MAG: ribonuclease P protein component [Lachnospiraceae bacterium]|nr:ribonuclease P protein component [Lachnospiraceae bacterium]
MKRSFETIRKSEDFKRAFRKGRRVRDGYGTLFAVENGLSCNRIGPVISKKVGNSVVRHRYCRLIREIFRLTDFSQTGYDIVVKAGERSVHAGYAELESSFRHLAGKLSLI